MGKRALISVSDKKGLVGFAQGLQKLGYTLISTGGTAQSLSEAGVKVTAVSDVTDFPEILGGRVKTLHPKIHGAILAQETAEHMQQLAELSIEPLDLVVVNLYPFRETVAKEGVVLAEAIENIDIGGPTLIRAAAKNYERVAIVVNPAHYEEILTELGEKGQVSLPTREKLALEAFAHTASYDVAISQYLSKVWEKADFPQSFFGEGEKIQDLRYGENPHQKAALFGFKGNRQGTLTGAQKLQGKELSYNNLVDIEATWSIVTEFLAPAAVIVKHTNPCGASLGKDIHEAYVQALESDPLSAFGGIVGLNREVDKKTAEEIIKTFLEVIIAPSFSEEARVLFAEKKNLRLIAMGELQTERKDYWYEPVSGGFLLQERDQIKIEAEDLKVVTKKQPTAQQIKELLYAWKIVKHVKSNAIVLTKNERIIGVGAGQMNRVGAARIALTQAKDQVKNSVLASDAFFPFSDTVEVAAQAGISAIIQPGGSIRDEDVIAKANEYGIVMVFTGIRHFKH